MCLGICLWNIGEVSKLEEEIAVSNLKDPFAFLPKSDDESDDNDTSVLSNPFDFFKGVRKSYIFGEIVLLTGSV